MTSEVVTALLAIGTSILFTLWIRWYDKGNKEKELNEKFKLYKGYAEEFLEACINSEFYIFSEVYSFDQLKVVLEKNPQNLSCNIFSKPKEDLILIYALGFLSKKYMLEFKELWLLRYILDNLV